MFTLSTWYTKEEITKRIAIFFFGMFGGTAVSPLLGAGLLRLDGRCGISGWQWIFLGETILPIPESQDTTDRLSGGNMVCNCLSDVDVPSP